MANNKRRYRVFIPSGDMPSHDPLYIETWLTAQVAAGFIFVTAYANNDGRMMYVFSEDEQNCTHQWKDEYNGTRCAECGLFYPDGCAPWDLPQDTP